MQAANTDVNLANFFIQEVDLTQLAKFSANFDNWPFAKQVLQLGGKLQPPIATLQWDAPEFGKLIHFRIGAVFVDPTAPITNVLEDLSESPTGAAFKEAARNRLVGAAKIAFAPALDHLVNCKHCKTLSPALDLEILSNGIKTQPPTADVVTRSVKHMGLMQVARFGPENRMTFVHLIREANSCLPQLPANKTVSFSDQLLSLALTIQKPSGRWVKEHNLHIPQDDRTEQQRINIHVRRRFRWFFFLLVLVSNSGGEYRVRGATLQDRNGPNIDNPACHSLIGDIDHCPPEMGWRYAEHGETLQRHPFFKAITSTVVLPKAYNDLDETHEGALYPKASKLLTRSAGGEDAYALLEEFCVAFELWGNQAVQELAGQEKEYVQAHLDEIVEIRQDPELRLIGPGDPDVDTFFYQYVEPIQEDDKPIDLTKLRDKLLSAD